jgi:CxxC motif-containing protein (DUF1111 family)
MSGTPVKMMRGFWWLAAAAMLLAASALVSNFVGARAGDEPAAITAKLGGDTTRAFAGETAFTMPAANIRQEHQRAFFFGNRLFNTNWVIAPASVKSFDGLGPLFNRVSCDGCHTQDGRGRPPLNDSETMDQMLIRLSVPDAKSANGTAPHPVYGDQLSELASPGIAPEGITKITREIMVGTFGDGEAYSLEKPDYRIEKLGYGPLGDGVMLSPRVAQQVIGLGLLEAVSEQSLVANADPDDKNGDGISGRPNRVIDPVTGQETIGRFGWKANQANLVAQNAAAAHGDIGLTSPIHKEKNCTATQSACLAAPTGDELDLSQSFLDRLTLYTRLLAVPAQRNRDDAKVIEGEKLFSQFGCAACHTPTLSTDDKALLPELAGQTIHPFTDLLLHDMGEGLSDNRPDNLATGSEWRTPPLWGIGHFEATNGHQRLLHDGRARGVAEAILWHGGEGAKAQEAFKNATKAERDALVAFVNSL